MATKAEIQSQINTIDDGGLNTAIEVRDVLGTNPSSLLENSYGTEIIEDESTLNGITVSNVNFKYDVKILKQGRSVSLNGSFTKQNLTNNLTLFEIDVTNLDYAPSQSLTKYTGSLYINNTGESIPLLIYPNGLVAVETFLAEESGLFHITYNTEN